MQVAGGQVGRWQDTGYMILLGERYDVYDDCGTGKD